MELDEGGAGEGVALDEGGVELDEGGAGEGVALDEGGVELDEGGAQSSSLDRMLY